MKIYNKKSLVEIQAEKDGASTGYIGLIQELQQQNEQLFQENAELREELNLTQQALNAILLEMRGE